MQAEMCKEMVFVPELDGGGFNITVFEPGTWNTSVQEKRSHCWHCADYFPPPHEAGDKAAAVRGAEGQSPRVANTHIHTKTLHQYYKPHCNIST